MAVIINGSQRLQNVDINTAAANLVNCMSTQTITEVNGTDVIDIRYRTNVGTFTVYTRSMILFS